MGLQWIFVWCLEKYQFYLFIPLVLTIILGMQWIKVYADYGSWILWVTVQYHIWGQRAFSTREGLRACPHPKKIFAKLKHFWCVFHDIQPINLIVSDYDVCPKLILVDILGKVFAMGVHVCVHNRHLYISVAESLLHLKAFKTRSLETNQAGFRVFL